MKRFFALLILVAALLSVPRAEATLYLVTAVSTNVATASTNYGTIYSTSETDHFISQTFQITHTNLLTTTNLTLIYRVTYDGGQTWANVTAASGASITNWLTGGTNTSPETWLPFGNTGANITRSNQVVAVTQTNASFTVLSAWNN